MSETFGPRTPQRQQLAATAACRTIEYRQCTVLGKPASGAHELYYKGTSLIRNSPPP